MSGTRWVIGWALVTLLPAALGADEPTLQLDSFEMLYSEPLNPPISLGSGAKVYGLRFVGAGLSKARLEIQWNAPDAGQGGLLAGVRYRPPTMQEVTFKLVPTTSGPRRYEVVGKNLQGRLVVLVGRGGDPQEKCVPNAAVPRTIIHRLLVLDDKGKPSSIIPLHVESRPTIPCHPGCFPAGTIVQTPKGPRDIATIQVGELVINVGPDGRTNPVRVASVFVGNSTLVEVHTDRGVLRTTGKQPLCLVTGEQKSSSQLRAGDGLAMWNKGRTTVQQVRDPGTPSRVYNLVLETPGVFVANGYLVKSKPPAHTGH